MNIQFLKNKFFVIPLCVILFPVITGLFSCGSNFGTMNHYGTGNYYFAYLRAKDTVYLLGNNYIEITLKNQTATLYRREDTSISYKISSGTDMIPEGLITPDGLYTVQSKSPIATSKQFNDAELFNWIGFNGNVGFHGLKGNGYYWLLGKRPSSHGCVRISREDGAELYKRVSLGSPVLVYHDEPALVLKFASLKEYKPEKDILLERNFKFNSKLFNNRVNSLYSGKALRNNYEKIFIDGKTLMKPGGFNIGIYEKVPARQYLPLVSRIFVNTERDNTYKLKPIPLIADSLFKSKTKIDSLKQNSMK
jgi:hypothetical protein